MLYTSSNMNNNQKPTDKNSNPVIKVYQTSPKSSFTDEDDTELKLSLTKVESINELFDQWIF